MIAHKHIVKFENCEKSQLIDKIKSLGCDNISKLNRVGKNYVVANLTAEQVSSISADENVVSVTKVPTPRPSNATLYFTSGTSVFVDGTQSIPLNISGTNLLSGTHYYNTDLDTVNEVLSVGVNEADNIAIANFDYQNYWLGRNIDIVIFDADLPNQALTAHSDHVDLAVSPQNIQDSRVQRVDWGSYSPAVTEAFNRQIVGDISIWSSHATGAASAAAGLFGGFAKSANIHVIHASGDDTIFDCFDAITSWVNTKPVNEVTGVRNPTIVYMGWAISRESNFVLIDDIESFNSAGVEITRTEVFDPLTGESNGFEWSTNFAEFREQNVPIVRIATDPTSPTGNLEWGVRVDNDFTVEEATIDQTIDFAIQTLVQANCIVVGAPKNDSKVFERKSSLRALDNVTCYPGHTLFTVHEEFLTPEYLHPSIEDFCADPLWAQDPGFTDPALSTTGRPLLTLDRTAWDVASFTATSVTFRRPTGEEYNQAEPFSWEGDPLNVNITVNLWNQATVATQESYKLFQAPIGYGLDVTEGGPILVTSALGSDYADALHWSSPRGPAFDFIAFTGGSGFANITAERPMYQAFGSYQPKDFSYFWNTGLDGDLIRWSMFGGTSAAAATVVGFLAIMWENLANRTQSLPSPADVLEFSRLTSKELLNTNLTMYPNTPVYDPAVAYTTDAYEINTSSGLQTFNLGVVRPNIQINAGNDVESFTYEYGLVDLFETRNNVVSIPDTIYSNPGLIIFASDDIIVPKAAVEQEPEARFYFGLNTQNSLSEIVDEREALRNLNLDINDLDRIRGIRDLGVTQDDLKTLSGLKVDLIRELKSISDSLTRSEFLFRDTKNEQFTFDEIVSEIKFEVDSKIISRSYKYSYVEPTLNAPVKFADVSTSRISSWSSFDDENIAAPIFYAGDVEVTKNLDDKSVVYATELSTKIEPIQRKYSSEVPTHLVTITVDGVDKQFYAMSGIPLNFYGRFRRIFDGGLSHTVVRDELDPKPVWAIQNLDETNTYFDFKELGDSQSISFLDFRTRPRLVQFYYDPSKITQLNVIDINLLTLPNAELPNLLKLDISSNDIKVMPDLVTFSPSLQELNISNNDLRRAETYTSSAFQLLNIPATVKKIDLTATLQYPESDVNEPSLAHLPHLQEVLWGANGIRAQIPMWHTTPSLARNLVDPVVGPTQVTPGVPYEIIDVGSGSLNPTGQLNTWTDYIDTFSIDYNTFRDDIQDYYTTTISGLVDYVPQLYEATASSSGSYVIFKQTPPSGTGVLRPIHNDIPLESFTYQNHISQFQVDQNNTWPLRFEAKISDTLVSAKLLKNVDLTGMNSVGIKCGEFNSTILLKPFFASENIETITLNGTALFPSGIKNKTNLTSFEIARTDAAYSNNIYFQRLSQLNWTFAKNDISISGENIFEGCISLQTVELSNNGLFIDLSNVCEGLTSLENVSFSNLIYGQFTRRSFSGSNAMKSMVLVSPNFGCITRAPWLDLDDNINVTALTNNNSQLRVEDIYETNTFDRFFEGDCLFDMQQLESFVVSGSPVSIATGAIYSYPPLPDDVDEESVVYPGAFAKGPLPDFSRNVQLTNLEVSNLRITGSLPDITNNIRLSELTLTNLWLDTFTTIENVSLRSLIIRGMYKLTTSNISPMPKIICPSLQTFELSVCPEIKGPFPSMGSSPLLNTIQVDGCSFESYTSGSLASLFELRTFNARYNNFRNQDAQQILKDIYSSYNVRPRSQGTIDLRNNGLSLTALLADGATLVAYNILVNVANWVVLID